MGTDQDRDRAGTGRVGTDRQTGIARIDCGAFDLVAIALAASDLVAIALAASGLVPFDLVASALVAFDLVAFGLAASALEAWGPGLRQAPYYTVTC